MNLVIGAGNIGTDYDRFHNEYDMTITSDNLKVEHTTDLLSIVVDLNDLDYFTKIFSNKFKKIIFDIYVCKFIKENTSQQLIENLYKLLIPNGKLYMINEIMLETIHDDKSTILKSKIIYNNNKLYIDNNTGWMVYGAIIKNKCRLSKNTILEHNLLFLQKSSFNNIEIAYFNYPIPDHPNFQKPQNYFILTKISI